jgi:hypothetical protein
LTKLTSLSVFTLSANNPLFFAGLPPNLEHFSLKVEHTGPSIMYARPTDTAQLARLTNLRSLHMEWTEHDLRLLEPLQNLEELLLSLDENFKMDYAALKNMPKLKRLKVQFNSPTRGDLYPHDLSTLEEAGEHIEELHVDRVGFNLGNMRNLKKLTVNKLDKNHMRFIEPVANQLEEFNSSSIYGFYEFQSEMFAHFAKLPKNVIGQKTLEDLRDLIYPLQISPADVEILLLQHTNLRNLEGLEMFPNLKTLSLPGTVEDFSGLLHLRKLTNFRLISQGRSFSNFRNQDFAWLQNSALSLTHIYISRSKLEILDGIRIFRNLNRFIIDYSSVRDLSPLRELKKLTHILVSESPVSNIQPIPSMNLRFAEFQYCSIYNNDQTSVLNRNLKRKREF